MADRASVGASTATRDSSYFVFALQGRNDKTSVLRILIPGFIHASLELSLLAPPPLPLTPRYPFFDINKHDSLAPLSKTPTQTNLRTKPSKPCQEELRILQQKVEDQRLAQEPSPSIFTIPTPTAASAFSGSIAQKVSHGIYGNESIAVVRNEGEGCVTKAMAKAKLSALKGGVEAGAGGVEVISEVSGVGSLVSKANEKKKIVLDGGEFFADALSQISVGVPPPADVSAGRVAPSPVYSDFKVRSCVIGLSVARLIGQSVRMVAGRFMC